jgi:hypothetical protein
MMYNGFFLLKKIIKQHKYFHKAFEFERFLTRYFRNEIRKYF